MTGQPSRVAFCPQCCNRAPQIEVYAHQYKTIWYMPDGTPDHDGPPSEAILCICSTCKEPLLYDGIARSEYNAWPELSYPEPAELHEAVPDNVRDVYREAAGIKSSAPRAFAVLIRLALEAICDEKLIRKGKLVQRLRLLSDGGFVPPVLAEMTDVLRTLGNAAAHKAPQAITIPMTWAIDGFFRAIVEYVYVAPSKLASFRASLEKLDNEGVVPIDEPDT